MSTPGRNGGPEVVVILWRDLPAQVNGQAGRRRHQVRLPDRFHRAIDRAKRRAKITTADDDVAQWRRVATPCGADLETAAIDTARRIGVDYPESRLKRIAFRGGWEQGT